MIIKPAVLVVGLAHVSPLALLLRVDLNELQGLSASTNFNSIYVLWGWSRRGSQVWQQPTHLENYSLGWLHHSSMRRTHQRKYTLIYVRWTHRRYSRSLAHWSELSRRRGDNAEPPRVGLQVVLAIDLCADGCERQARSSWLVQSRIAQTLRTHAHTALQSEVRWAVDDFFPKMAVTRANSANLVFLEENVT